MVPALAGRPDDVLVRAGHGNLVLGSLQAASMRGETATAGSLRRIQAPLVCWAGQPADLIDYR